VLKFLIELHIENETVKKPIFSISCFTDINFKARIVNLKAR